MGKKSVDHLGKEYASVADMYRAYGVDKSTYYDRLQSGWSIKDILTSPIRRYHDADRKYIKDIQSVCVDENGCYFDHAGHKFRMLDELCDAYGVNRSTFKNRILAGWSLESALTIRTKPKKSIESTAYKVFDSYYPTARAIADKFGIGFESVRMNITNIDAYIRSLGIIEFDGVVYKNLSVLALEYGISVGTLRNRLSHGWDLDRALKTPVQHHSNNKVCKDHLGNEFESRVAMLLHYNITYNAYVDRTRSGWSLEATLTTPIRSVRRNNIASNKLLATGDTV